MPYCSCCIGDDQVPIIWKCFPCDFPRANELFTNKCLQSVDHKGVEETQLVCRSSKMDKLVAIKPLPRNKKRMLKLKIRYAFKHSQANCPNPHGNCVFPHSCIEEEAWNLLLNNEATSKPKVCTVIHLCGGLLLASYGISCNG